MIGGVDARAILEALTEPAMVVRGGTIRAANGAARKLFGTLIEGSDLRLAIRHPQALECILEGRSGDHEISGLVDLERPWTVSIAVLPGGSVLARLLDRTAAVGAERIRVDFVANASHELRTPLASILGYAETLVEDSDLEVGLRQRFAETIRFEAERMLNIIEDLMMLSRIEADRFVAPSETVDVASLARSAVANVQAGSVAQNCEFRIDVAGPPRPVTGDRAQLLQLLENLLTNAVRYGCSDGKGDIRVSIANQGRWVILSVKDSGPGIAREHIPRLTERFYRVDASRSRDGGGTGLGLSIVKHIVERHRGHLAIESSLGAGTEVVVRLPAAA